MIDEVELTMNGDELAAAAAGIEAGDRILVLGDDRRTRPPNS